MKNIKDFESKVYSDYVKKAEKEKFFNYISKNEFILVLTNIRKIISNEISNGNNCPYVIVELDEVFNIYTVAKDDKVTVNIWDKEQTRFLLKGDNNVQNRVYKT